MTLNNHIIFNPEAVEPLHASLHVEIPRPNEDPIVPAPQKRSLIGPKETNLDVTPQADPDTDDNMETTSLTDDDPTPDHHSRASGVLLTGEKSVVGKPNG